MHSRTEQYEMVACYINGPSSKHCWFQL